MEILVIIVEYVRHNWIDIVGYIASMFVATTFYMKTMIPLRIIGIISNILFITYGFAQGLYPVLILHLILFPLNIIRLREMKKLIADVKMASKYESAMEPLLPFMTKKRYKKGDVLFNKNDEADTMYYLGNGSIKLVDLGIDVGEKQLIGEMGIFSPFKKRTDTAVCNCNM
ncbi:cyclic nucleotide-binding domain-containing protein, partial [bacterium]|nr:cyclic nucleotide-binding domain-containing protein [bacterium]